MRQEGGSQCLWPLCWEEPQMPPCKFTPSFPMRLDIASPLIILMDQVPVRCHPKLNQLMADAEVYDRLDATLKQPGQALFDTWKQTNSSWVTYVTGVVRKLAPPKTIEGASAAILHKLDRLNTTIEGILDILRFQVSSTYPFRCIPVYDNLIYRRTIWLPLFVRTIT